MLLGPEGDHAILDMMEGSIIEDGTPADTRWSTFLSEFSEKAGNVPRVVAEEKLIEVESHTASDEADDQPTAPPEIS